MTVAYHVDNHAQLSAYNTMALSCITDKLITVYNESQLEHAVKEWHINQASLASSLFVLSGGSNVLLPPHLNTCVLRPMLTGIDIIKEDANQIYIEVAAGVNWHDLVLKTVKKGWYGLENLALIPGLTGAAPIQNIGAYGVQLEDVFTHAKALHIPSMTWYQFDKAQSKFGYRDSIFKQQLGDWVITKVGLHLHKDASRVQADYADVQPKAVMFAAAANRALISPMDVMQAIISIRRAKLPDPKILPNCGSFFKNPIISVQQYAALKADFPSMVGYPLSVNTVKVAAGWLIEHAQLKGKGIAPILTHDKQALVLTNHATGLAKNSKTPPLQATQLDIATTQTYIQKLIYDKYAIVLEREPLWINSNGQVNFNNISMHLSDKH